MSKSITPPDTVTVSPAPDGGNTAESQHLIEFAECLVEANREGRRIIPVIGAGISADSGFPVIRSIVRYFGKLQQFIDLKGWLPDPDDDALAPALEPFAIRYRQRPWDYVRDFGWPDRFQLNDDLLRLLEKKNAGRAHGKPEIVPAVREGLEALLKDSHRPQMSAFEELRSTLRKAEPKLAAVPDTVRKKFLRLLERTDYDDSVAWNLFGDWKRTILHFTDFQSDYADALLSRFARERGPNLGHRILAFLARRFSIPAVFTMNFDPWIEEALDDEDLHPLAFSMEHGLTLPHHTLVQDVVAVIKMHGSTHSLLLDERLDRPLSKEYLERFDSIVGRNPLLLVIGCSGEDRRLMDLVKHVLGVSEMGTPKDADPNFARVAWIHYEERKKVLKSVPILAQHSQVRLQRTNNIGGTLLHLFTLSDLVLPASRAPYLTHAQQPMLIGEFESEIPPKVTKALGGKMGGNRPRQKPHPAGNTRPFASAWLACGSGCFSQSVGLAAASTHEQFAGALGLQSDLGRSGGGAHHFGGRGIDHRPVPQVRSQPCAMCAAAGLRRAKTRRRQRFRRKNRPHDLRRHR